MTTTEQDLIDAGLLPDPDAVNLMARTVATLPLADFTLTEHYERVMHDLTVELMRTKEYLDHAHQTVHAIRERATRAQRALGWLAETYIFDEDEFASRIIDHGLAQ